MMPTLRLLSCFLLLPFSLPAQLFDGKSAMQLAEDYIKLRDPARVDDLKRFPYQQSIPAYYKLRRKAWEASVSDRAEILMMNTIDVAAILLMAAVLRLTLLDLRPPHADEGIDGWLAETMTWSQGYHYRPEVAHGPLHFYLLKLSLACGGRSYFALRLPTALFGIGSVALGLAFAPFIGRRAAQMAAIVMAVSPSFTWVSRYAIHEMELVFFTLLCGWGLLRLFGGFSVAGMVSVVGGAVGCLLTKETAPLHLAALVCGFAAASAPWPGSRLRWKEKTWRNREVFYWVAAWAAGLFVLWGFYTSFGSQPDGWERFADGFTRWAVIGTSGEEHAKPWSYWLTLLAGYEVPLLSALAGSVLLAKNGGRPIRFVTAASLVLFLGYSLVPYKTPWCLVSVTAFLAFAGWLCFRCHAPWLARRSSSGCHAAACRLGGVRLFSAQLLALLKPCGSARLCGNERGHPETRARLRPAFARRAVRV